MVRPGYAKLYPVVTASCPVTLFVITCIYYPVTAVGMICDSSVENIASKGCSAGPHLAQLHEPLLKAVISPPPLAPPS